jgi:hypothetical protein
MWHGIGNKGKKTKEQEGRKQGNETTWTERTLK